MRINESVALVSSASRGIGRAFVEALFELGATRLYAAGDVATLEPIARRDRTREHMETNFVGAWNVTRRSSPCSSAMRLPSFP
jgi:NADP-dependent 3-hydroxy acid dehydrogenase YdfG